MKKLTIWMIFSNWVQSILVPIVYKCAYGKYPGNLQSLGIVPEIYMTKVAIIVTIVFFVSALLIYLIPRGDKQIKETIQCNLSYYYIALFIYVVLAISGGVLDFYNVVTGGTNSTLLSYYSLFFYPVIIFLVFLFCIKNKGSILIFVGSYLILTLISHSRSGAVHLVIYLIGFALATDVLSIKKLRRRASDAYRKYHKQIKCIVLILIIIAPIVFVYSTYSRGSIVSDNEHRVTETIAARCSCLDEAGLALYMCERNEQSEKLFLEKYGVVNQMKCIIDSSIPGSLFEGDVDPNQYYRAIVGYMSATDAARYYSSTNLMLPIYMVMKYGVLAGTLFSVMIITIFYMVVCRIRNNVWQVILISIILMEMITFFDWVMIWRAFLRAALTVVTFELITRYMSIRNRRVRFRLNGTMRKASLK